MSRKMYRTRQEFRYAPTGFFYAVGIIDSLTDWHPDDIKEALRNLIEEIATPENPPISKVEGPSKPSAEGTHSKDEVAQRGHTKELTNG